MEREKERETITFNYEISNAPTSSVKHHPRIQIRRDAAEGRPNFLDIFCAQVGIRGPRRTSIKSGNRVEIEARRIGETAVIGPPRLSSCRSSLDRLSLFLFFSLSLSYSRPVVNLFQDILDHCTPHYVFVYVRGGSSADNFPFPLCHFCVPRALKERRMAGGGERPIVFPSRSTLEGRED